MPTHSEPIIEQQLVAHRLVPVAVVDAVEDAVTLARTLAGAGLPVLEITLRTAVALSAIQAIRRECPEVLVGAGTVLEPAQVRAAIEAGARFGVSPGVNDQVIEAARGAGWTFVPGVMTPSEIERALGHGCRLQKFFPAEPAGGVKLLKALAGPYAHTGVRFVPLGGVQAENMAAYLALPMVAAVGGSWLCERGAIQGRRWEEIATVTRAAVAQAARL